MNSKKLPPQKSDSETPPLDLRQEEDFAAKYASHVATEPTGWDLKLTFGRVDSSVGTNGVLQHTSISLPWPTVKCLIYLLRLQLIAYEKNNGHVPFPPGGINPLPRSVPKEFATYPKAEAIHEALLKLYDEFVADNPEAFPQK
jgi:hypothetical protein